MAGGETTASGTRRWRVPYEWILGAMFVASFGPPRWRGGFAVRALWLLVVMPIACRAFGVRRSPGALPPRFGVLLPVAALGWLYVSAWVAVVAKKRELSQEFLGSAIDILRGAWSVPTGLSVACLVAAASRPGRYRETGVFLNAAFLLVIAWGLDL